MRASQPQRAGTIDRDGIRVAYDVHGRGDTTLVMIPPSPITHARIYKAQVPFLARYFRVVTVDGRGNGASDQPPDPAAHSRAENLADFLAVLDATDTDEAILVGHCTANWWAVEFAHLHRDRVIGLVAIAPGVPYLGPVHQHWLDTHETWDEILHDPQGWDLNNRHVYLTEHRRWIEWFFGQQLVEAHSTKQFEDAVEWALESTGEVLAAGEEGIAIDLPSRQEFESMVTAIDYPVLVIHGDRDVCQHVDRGREFAERAGGEVVVIEGAGHLALARDPVRVNLAIEDFLVRLGSRVVSK